MTILVENKEELDNSMVKPFTINLTLSKITEVITTPALVDLGADLNVMSYETWTKLGQSTLSTSTLTFKSFAGIETASLGELTTLSQIKGHSILMSFHVAQCGQTSIDLIWGFQWIASNNLKIDWNSQEFSLTHQMMVIKGKNLELEELPRTSSPKLTSIEANSYKWIIDEENPNNGWRFPTSILLTQGYGRGENLQRHY